MAAHRPLIRPGARPEPIRPPGWAPARAGVAVVADDPPLTIAAVCRRWPVVVPLALVVTVVFGVGAAIDGGRPLVWDVAITDAAVAHRTAWLDRVALGVTQLGAWTVVVPIGVALAVLAARRSTDLAVVIVVVLAGRPLLTLLLKELIDRPRPSGARLVGATGDAYPSGHVLAAAMTWAFLPPVVALYIRRRAIWWAAVAGAAAVVAVVAWSRVWLGVHWTSDVVAGLLLAFLALALIEAHLAGRPPRRRSSDARPTGSKP